jgi:hypothetical protein
MVAVVLLEDNIPTVYEGFANILLEGLDSECGKFKDADGNVYDLVKEVLKLGNVAVGKQEPDIYKEIKQRHGISDAELLVGLRGMYLVHFGVDKPSGLKALSTMGGLREKLAEDLVKAAKASRHVAFASGLDKVNHKTMERVVEVVGDDRNIIGGVLEKPRRPLPHLPLL